MSSSSLKKLVPLIQQARITGKKNILDNVIASIGDAKVVMIGEASHGTHEFYEYRADLTRRLIQEKGFDCVCIEGDWPDSYKINKYVRGIGTKREAFSGFKSRFPTWMWRNTVTVDFATWLRNHNEKIQDEKYKVGIYGMDLYSLYQSSVAVIDYLKEHEPSLVSIAKKRYSCFDRESLDPQEYGLASAYSSKRSCQEGAVKMLQDMIKIESEEMQESEETLKMDKAFYARINAQVVRDAEEYYRSMYQMKNTWNLRDGHMTKTLQDLIRHFEELRHTEKGPGKELKTVVWAHNSHLGDSSFTEFAERGETNVGTLVRQKFGINKTYNVGFSTYSGTVTAANEWDDPAETMRVRPATEGTYEHLWHSCSPPDNTPILLRFRSNVNSNSNSNSNSNLEGKNVAGNLSEAEANLARSLNDIDILQRAIGVVYRPMTERQSHLFTAIASKQFDALIHIDQTSALKEVDDRFLSVP